MDSRLGRQPHQGRGATRPDWCISRQRTWGVPIPAFYDAKGEPILDAQIVRNAADLIEKHGSNVWFEKSAAELWSLVKPADWTGAEAAAKSNDTLDVWIDSGSSSRAVIAQRKELAGEMPATPVPSRHVSRGQRPASRLVSIVAAALARGQRRGAVQDRPDPRLHGGCRPRERFPRASRAAYEKPQTAEAYVKKYGADVVRLWVASQDFRNDIIVSEERINKVGETYRGIRNALRYQLSNLYDFDPAKHAVPDDKLTGLDRWILGEFSKLEQEVIAAYDDYEFHVVYQKISQFIAVELSSIYHDVIKDRLYTDAGEFAAPPLDADRAAPAGDRPVPDARADSGVHGGRSVGICAGRNRPIRSMKANSSKPHSRWIPTKSGNGTGLTCGAKHFCLNWKKRARKRKLAKLWMQKSKSQFRRFKTRFLIEICCVSC